MSDESFDPWKSLASELGVDPNAAPPPPPAPVPVAPAPTYSRPASAAIEPKKQASDWSALASDLGIEVPAEPAKPAARKEKDPVAELLGWPAPPRAAEPAKTPVNDLDDFDDHEPWGRSDQRDRWGDDEEQPLALDEPANEQRGDRREAQTDRDDGPRRGRRRRGGRGRGRRDGGGDRPSEGRSGESRSGENRGGEGRGAGGRGGDRGSRRPAGEGYRGEDSRPQRRSIEGEPFHDQPISDEDEPIVDFGEGEDLAEKPAATDEPGRRPRRRRGRRRGRGGERNADRSGEERSGADRGGRKDQRSGSERRASGGADFDESEALHFSDDLDDLEGIGEEHDEEFAGVIADDTRARDDDDHNDDHDDDHDDGPRGKNSVRDIMTWKEAIGVIVDNNIQERARNPRSGGQGRGHSRGGQGGEGQGRTEQGRGGHGYGNQGSGGQGRGGQGRGGHGGRGRRGGGGGRRNG